MIIVCRWLADFPLLLCGRALSISLPVRQHTQTNLMHIANYTHRLLPPNTHTGHQIGRERRFYTTAAAAANRKHKWRKVVREKKRRTRALKKQNSRFGCCCCRRRTSSLDGTVPYTVEEEEGENTKRRGGAESVAVFGHVLFSLSPLFSLCSLGITGSVFLVHSAKKAAAASGHKLQTNHLITLSFCGWSWRRAEECHHRQSSAPANDWCLLFLLLFFFFLLNKPIFLIILIILCLIIHHHHQDFCCRRWLASTTFFFFPSATINLQ